ncbi:hypothetical protein AB1Y20_009410 [Prymnesium parvum]
MCPAATPAPPMEYGVGMSQDDFMKKDECLIVNYNDEITGYDNKYNVHKFVRGQPKGIVHRAFSVMLFDAEGKLLLQQRAAEKITFPQVWTNTCCSHPLYGQTPSEVDAPGVDPVGVKRAAVRKLRHELGIKAGALSVDRFKYMGRVHYWAADCLTHGPAAPWGEHEIDYLLLYQLQPGEVLELDPHPEEVMAVDWVTAEELQARMADPALGFPLWSPWFRVIVREKLLNWWNDLDATWKLPPEENIFRFDAFPEHVKADGSHAGKSATELGDIGSAERELQWASEERRALCLRMEVQARRRDLSRSASGGVKQGAYGKVIAHKHSKIDQLMRFSEVSAALYLKFIPGAMKNNLKTAGDDDLKFCDEKLGQVSRSFAAVIRQLPSELAKDILVFYLVLRALDTIEDDMEAFKDSPKAKCEHLKAFGEKYLGDESWTMDGVGEGSEKELLQNFNIVSRFFNRLPKGSQDVIRDITIKMGHGMASYVTVDLGQGTVDMAAYARYCHMVAGLVGEGLTRAFISRKLESEDIAGQGEMVWPFCKKPKECDGKTLGLANSMGLFLQKTNIIRDYLEDYVDARAFWPQEAWKKFARTSELGELARPTAFGAGLERYPFAFDANSDPQGASIVGKGARTSSVNCLNFLVADALELVPDALAYLGNLKTPEVFQFCAIPQVMAIATLESCFDNPQVFTGVVKIRKGLAARLMIDSADQNGVHFWFNKLAKRIITRTPPDDPSKTKIVAAAERIIELTDVKARLWKTSFLASHGVIAILALMLACIVAFLLAR